MTAESSAAPFAYEGLDRVFHEKARLGIVSSLAGQPEGLRFGDVKALCGLTDGNLSRHLQVLEEAGFVVVEKTFNGREPQTVCRLTDLGRERFAAYLDVLQQVLRQAEQATQAAGPAFGLRQQPT
jgi:DNA-binding HxlR family transcriptional regulator